MSDEVKLPEKPTVPLSQTEIVNARLDKLEKVIVSRFDRTDANIEIVSSDLRNTKEDLRISKENFSSQIQKLEQRADGNSIRAGRQTKSDLEQVAQLAQERAAREALATKVDGIDKKQDVQTVLMTEARNAVVKVWQNPKVTLYAGLIAAALWTAFVHWLDSKGVHVQQ